MEHNSYIEKWWIIKLQKLTFIISGFKSYSYLFELNWFSTLDFKVEFCSDLISDLATINRTALIPKNDLKEGFSRKHPWLFTEQLDGKRSELLYPWHWISLMKSQIPPISHSYQIITSDEGQDKQPWRRARTRKTTIINNITMTIIYRISFNLHIKLPCSLNYTPVPIVRGRWFHALLYIWVNMTIAEKKKNKNKYTGRG